jgi:NADPH-dependent glutamate synthase beta subunit-like oxidoreductase/NAD(P)H-flavin reductase
MNDGNKHQSAKIGAVANGGEFTNQGLFAGKTNPILSLQHGLTLTDLYATAGLRQLDEHFVSFLSKRELALSEQLQKARSDPAALTELAHSQLILALAPWLEEFLAQLFGIQVAVEQLQQQHTELAPLFLAKRKFVQRVALRAIPVEEALALEQATVELRISTSLPHNWSELDFANAVTQWQAIAEQDANFANAQNALEAAKQYAAWAVHHPAGRAKHSAGVLFKTANGVDPDHLVPHIKTKSVNEQTVSVIHFEPKHLRRREGFKLTDNGRNLAYALDQANYCIWCHAQGRDSCSKGLKHKQREAGKGKEAFKQSVHGVTLAGCPLEERISEFQQLKAQAVPIGALAVICVDNPMVAATGHRICNDCMKACIYQKQEAVNIPEVETKTLKDVLALPWGFEIYSLLTRWNPLNIYRPFPLADTGKRVLVVGQGPAGFTLAHHLMNDGHQVVAIDGLKIEPLPVDLIGKDGQGYKPIFDVKTLIEELDERVLAGFGGVAEYGITVRWDKNFLRVVRLLLQRRTQFELFGGVRFGGTLTAEQALAFGFDHIALAIGAGKPTTLSIPNGLARGVRVASDFLMALQLTGAGKKDSIANLQVRLPIVVIGGGLTAIDTATESLAYYVVQIEKFLLRVESLSAQGISWDNDLSDEERSIGQEFMLHAQAIRNERKQAQIQNREPNVIGLLRRWGGATIAYRKRLIDAPSYTLNHEEVEKALEEGIYIAQQLNPKDFVVDAFGAVQAINFESVETTGATSENKRLPARAIFIAAGTSPNTVLAREDGDRFKLDGKYFQTIDIAGQCVSAESAIAKPNAVQVLTHKTKDGRFVSFFGDVHPSFFGNVVKAMASAKNGYPIVSQVLSQIPVSSDKSNAEFIAQLREGLNARVHVVRRLTPTIVEVVVKAPWAARNFEPGQFYRLQNFETSARRLTNLASGASTMQMEGLALTGAWVDKEQGLLSTIVLEMGGSSNLCIDLQPNEEVILMGPTGTPTEIPRNETVMLVGGGLGNAVLFSIGAALRAAGCTVLYFAGYKKIIDRYKIEEIEAAADTIVWCCDEAPGFKTNPARPQDKSFVGNIVQAIRSYADGSLDNNLSANPTKNSIQVKTVDRIIAIGSDRMMAAVARARHNELKPYLKLHHHAVGSINSPMQCMMKEICGQCLQEHTDPITGKKSVVFSCYNQDQELDSVDWANLNARLTQNLGSEKLTAKTISLALVKTSN